MVQNAGGAAAFCWRRAPESQALAVAGPPVGAFTPGCSKTHLPGYVAAADKIKAHGARGLSRAVADFLVEERAERIRHMADLADLSPFRRDGEDPGQG